MKARFLAAMILVAILVAMLVAPALAQSDKQRFGWLIADKVTVVNSMDVLGTTSYAVAPVMAGGVDLDGTALTIDADADTILDESADDVVGLTMGAATGTFSVLTGNFKVGNGTPGQALNAEDAYVEGTFENDAGAYFDGATEFGGAYGGGSGCTISAAGVLQCNGAITGDSSLTIDSVGVGGGYAGSGAAISNAGVGQFNGALTTDGNLTALSGDFGGTYGTGTACTISSAGALSCNDAITSDAAVTALSASIGGGYAGSGAAISDAGVGQFNGALTTDGTLTAAAVAAVTGAFTGDVTLTADATVGNAGAKTEFIGLPRIKLAGVGVKDGVGEVEVDDSPAAEWTNIDANVTDTADTSYYKVGANSLKLAFGAGAAAGTGATNATPGADWTGMKSIGFWVYADKVFTAAQLVLYLTDATDPSTLNTCAYTTASVWQYCEVDITSLAGTVGDMVTDIDVRMAAGLNVPINIYVDNMVVWAAGDEVSLTVALQQDGDLGFINALTGAALDPSADYTIAWRTGVDYIVVIADLDPDGAFGMVAY